MERTVRERVGYESTRLLILIESIVCVRVREGVPLRDLW